jgi:hypothetical protein
MVVLPDPSIPTITSRDVGLRKKRLISEEKLLPIITALRPSFQNPLKI